MECLHFWNEFVCWSWKPFSCVHWNHITLIHKNRSRVERAVKRRPADLIYCGTISFDDYFIQPTMMVMNHFMRNNNKMHIAIVSSTKHHLDKSSWLHGATFVEFQLLMHQINWQTPESDSWPKSVFNKSRHQLSNIALFHCLTHERTQIQTNPPNVDQNRMNKCDHAKWSCAPYKLHELLYNAENSCTNEQTWWNLESWLYLEVEKEMNKAFQISKIPNNLANIFSPTKRNAIPFFFRYFISISSVFFLTSCESHLILIYVD